MARSKVEKEEEEEEEGGSGRERERARTSGAGMCGEGDGMTWKRADGREGDAGSLADYVAGWSGERNPGEDAALRCRSVGRSVGGVEETGSLVAAG